MKKTQLKRKKEGKCRTLGQDQQKPVDEGKESISTLVRVFVLTPFTFSLLFSSTPQRTCIIPRPLYYIIPTFSRSFQREKFSLSKPCTAHLRRFSRWQISIVCQPGVAFAHSLSTAFELRKGSGNWRFQSSRWDCGRGWKVKVSQLSYTDPIADVNSYENLSTAHNAATTERKCTFFAVIHTYTGARIWKYCTYIVLIYRCIQVFRVISFSISIRLTIQQSMCHEIGCIISKES